VVASLAALAAADAGAAVGLFDLDFTSPSDHLILGARDGFPVERFGIEPVEVSGLGLMSMAFLSGTAPSPMRGADATSALLELLAITRWGDRDLLVLDLPPGLGDTTLDLIRLVPRAEYVLVGAGSLLAAGSVTRALRLLVELGVPLVGLVENMAAPGQAPRIREMADAAGVPYLGAVPLDPGLEEALGSPERLRRTAAYRAVKSAVGGIADPDGR
jgi:ATP-binding protein involved in chromosome partitioning